MREPVMMACGHTAQAWDRQGNPYCVICDEGRVAESKPVLTGRTARCFHYGQKYSTPNSYHGCECDVCRKDESGRCHCERPSSEDLAFFMYKPNDKYDEFYCGCHSWE